MDTVYISPSKDSEREEHESDSGAGSLRSSESPGASGYCEVPSEPPTTYSSPPTSSTSTWTEADQEEFGKLDESEQIQKIYDFLVQSEKKRAEQSFDRESLLSQAQVVIKEKLSNISDVLNT